MKKLIPITLLAAPIITFAALDGTLELVGSFGLMIRTLIPILIGLALVVFFWGIIQYLFTDAKEKGSKLMFWGIVALFVMVSVWGLIKFLGDEIFGTLNNSAPSFNLPSS